MHALTRRSRHEEGAAAVEFALVSSVLFLVLFGMIQYGLWFSDSLSTRQGVREGARHAVVESFGYDASCTTGTNSARLRCSTRKDIGAIAGTPYVKVNAANWQKGKAVVVCAMVKADGALGLLPMPNGGWITSKTQMSIEQATQAGAWTNTADALPAGATWDWCS
ncbi:MAG: pilus assembly protein [Nocardioidaceae bacterium]|nr:pilus assembly protein [Nocardioidaceae bacterium]